MFGAPGLRFEEPAPVRDGGPSFCQYAFGKRKDGVVELAAFWCGRSPLSPSTIRLYQGGGREEIPSEWLELPDIDGYRAASGFYMDLDGDGGDELVAVQSGIEGPEGMSSVAHICTRVGDEFDIETLPLGPRKVRFLYEATLGYGVERDLLGVSDAGDIAGSPGIDYLAMFDLGLDSPPPSAAIRWPVDCIFCPALVDVADIDGDGIDDISAFSELFDGGQCPTHRVRVARSGGEPMPSFTDVLDLEPTVGAAAVAFGDIDGDGRPDVIVAHHAAGGLVSEIAVWFNDTTPSDATLQLRPGPVSVVPGINVIDIITADLDGDGLADIIAFGRER